MVLGQFWVKTVRLQTRAGGMGIISVGICQFGSVLSQFWVSFGSVLGQFWVSFGSVLGQSQLVINNIFFFVSPSFLTLAVWKD